MKGQPLSGVHFSFTREGKRFLISTGVLLFAALNTGNNLIYLILAMMLALGSVAIVLPFINLRGLHLDLEIPETLFAGTETNITIRAYNRKAIPSYSVRINLGFSQEDFYIKRVPPKGLTEVSKVLLFPKRGIHNITHLKVSTSFPFIFFTCTKSIPCQKKIIIYPELLEMEGPFMEDALSDTSLLTIKTRTGDYPQSFRQYMEGDPLRHIHWKATAKLQSLMVKEFYRERTEELTIVLDNSGPVGEELFERAVSICATVLVSVSEMEIPFKLVSCDKAFPFGSGRTHLLAQLDYLAGVTQTDSPECRLKEKDKAAVLLVAPQRPSPLEGKIDNIIRTYYASSL